MSSDDLTITHVDRHRNGVGGNPFRVIHFTDKREGNMIAIWFYDQTMSIAVFDFDLLKAGETRFMHNSWRGDNYARPLKSLLDKWEDEETNF